MNDENIGSCKDVILAYLKVLSKNLTTLSNAKFICYRYDMEAGGWGTIGGIRMTGQSRSTWRLTCHIATLSATTLRIVSMSASV